MAFMIASSIIVLVRRLKWFILISLISCKRVNCSLLAPVRNGVDFARALAASNVELIIVENDLHVDASAWEGLDLPLMIRRNVTIRASPSIKMPVISVTSSDNSIRLAEGVTFTVMEAIVLQNRGRLGMMSPGLDMLAPCPANESGSFTLLRDVWILHPLCLHWEAQISFFRNSTRPSAFPGPQLMGPLLPQPTNCTNSSSAPLMQRCWPQLGLYEDVALIGQDPDERGRLLPTNIFIWMLNVQYACASIMSDVCIQELGMKGCFLFMSAQQRSPLGVAYPPSPAPPFPHQSVSPPPLALSALLRDVTQTDGDRQGPLLLPVVLPCVLGGLFVAALAVIVPVAWITWRRRLRSRYSNRGKLAPIPECVNEDSMCKGRAVESQALAPSDESNERPQQLHAPGGKPVATAAAAGLASVHAGATPACNPEVIAVRTVTVAVDYCIPALDAPFIVTPFTQHRSDLKLDVQWDTEVALLPVVRGQGNFGRVVEGMYGGERVAVKLVPDLSQWSGAGGTAALQSYVQEVEVLGRCSHPNVVRLLAACVTPPRLCLVMELMEISLDKLIHSRGAAWSSQGQGDPQDSGSGGTNGISGSGAGSSGYRDCQQVLLPLEKVLHVGIEVARGLEYLHPTIVHRDLKPGNVLLNDPHGPRPVVKLTDFGLSRLRSTVLVTRHPEAGTPSYMAPELYDIRNNVVTDKSDMYSLGVLLWEMLTGLVPWQGCDPLVVAYAVTINRDRLPLSGILPERMPPKLQRLIERLWDHDPLRRPAAAEVVKQLALIQQSLETGRAVSQMQQQQQQQQMDPKSQVKLELHGYENHGNIPAREKGIWVNGN
ncbi:hypothetical protein Vafri_7974 [Volvox africanus]|uniref:Protein kinase domain-containing protein n=1 Tax=Volvox africanus TaxID=51714 RepID=A0A8J4B1T5_9CHLO|nr:hypothetical protein Vafri_7974 [Volvox africanus]